MLKLNLSPKRKLIYLLILFLALLYPGQNKLQKIILTPGEIKNYDLSSKTYAAYPLNNGEPAPATTSYGVVVQDVMSRTIIYSRNPDTLLLPASTTKVMTALVALDHWQNLDEVLIVKNEDRAIGQTVNLVKKEQLTVRSLLFALLIHSGNDAALTLAENYPGGYSNFVETMNSKARSLNLAHTTYKNPSGIEQYGHVTTPRDLAILAAVAMQNPIIKEIVNTKFAMITDVTGQITHPLESTNELLGVIPGLIGLKTGWTTNAGECLISYVEQQGHPVVIVVLKSANRFDDTRALIDWVYTHHTWQAPRL